MLQKPQRSTTTGSRPNLGGAGLDQARLGSMADEGGTSGATMDAQEQCAALGMEVRKRSWPVWLALSVVVAGVAALAGAWFGRSSRDWLRRRF